MLFNRLIYSYNDCPIYSDAMLPYVPPTGSEACCTINGAKKIIKRGPEYNRNGKVNIRYLKAKMTLHMNLEIGEMARLLQAQVNANGYAHKKGFNVLKGVPEAIMKSARYYGQF